MSRYQVFPVTIPISETPSPFQSPVTGNQPIDPKVLVTLFGLNIGQKYVMYLPGLVLIGVVFGVQMMRARGREGSQPY